ncbi:DUF190 domain-containing protein [bacterium]|nr:DUF190 domain-containing protein [bacterium]
MLKYHVIEIFTSEETRFHGKPLYQAVLERVRAQRIAARCTVTKGVAGCYENGEIASHGIEILSFNMPLKIEIILPAPELDRLLPAIEAMVEDGIIVVEEMDIRLHRAKSRLLPRQLLVRDAMTPLPQTVKAATPASDVARLLLSATFNGVPVVDDEQRPIGIITQGDLITRAGMPVRLGILREMEDDSKSQELFAAMPTLAARDIMSKPPVTVKEEERLVAAVNLMLSKGLKRVPVVDASGKLAGVLARLDIFRTIMTTAPDWDAMRAQRVDIREARFVRDIMRRDTHVVPPDTPVLEVLKIIDDNDIQRVAVVGPAGEFLGLISDRTLLGAFSEHRAGWWDYLVSKLIFLEIGKRPKELLTSLENKTAREVMQTDLITVREETPIEEAVRVMVEKRIKRLPVLDGEGKFKGMVSRDSLLRAGVAEP